MTASRSEQAPLYKHSRCALADIDSLRNDRGLAATDIDWERLLTTNYRHYVQPGGLIIDVGAHNGMHSRRIRRYLSPAQLKLVEPLPSLAQGLRREFARHDHIEVREVALAAESGTAMFVVNDNSLGESGLKDRYAHEGSAAATHLVEVTVECLDDWQLSQPVSFIKVDVEGGELDVLAGATSLISRDRPIISIEFGLRSAGVYGYSADDLVHFAHSHQLAILDLFGNELSPQEFAEVVGTYYWDYLLIPREQLPGLATTRTALRAEALRSIDTFNPTVEKWKKRLRR